MKQKIGVNIFPKSHSIFPIKVSKLSSYTIPFDCLLCYSAFLNDGSERIFDDREGLNVYNSYDYAPANPNNDGSATSFVCRWFVEGGSVINTTVDTTLNMLPIESDIDYGTSL